jgi:hypothetical protein
MAICGLNKRRVMRKVYGPDDLVSVQSQTDETLESDEFVLDENTERKLRRLWRNLN